MTKIYLDAGHGGTDSGAIGNGLKEKDLTLKIVLKIKKLLEDYKVDVRLSRSTDKTVSLVARTDDANKWGADYLVSVHINAFGDKDGNGDGDGFGYEDYIYSKHSTTSKSPERQKIMHNELKDLFPKNRGMQKKNLHMLRESTMSAILTESGFIDNSDDAKLLKSDAFLYKVAMSHVVGLVKIFNLKKKEVVKPVVEKPKTTHEKRHTHYSVQLGDTLSSIALFYGVSVGEVLEMNPDIKNRNQIFVGNLLNIPLK